MRPNKTAARTLALLILLATCGQTSSSTNTKCRAQACVDAITLALNQDNVAYIEILRVPLNLETRAAITPQALERIYYTKVSIRNISGTPLQRKMAESFKATSIQPRDYIADLRWGVIFYSREGARIGAVYFDRSGRFGAIDDVGVSFHGDFFHWLESLSSSCPSE